MLKLTSDSEERYGGDVMSWWDGDGAAFAGYDGGQGAR